MAQRLPRNSVYERTVTGIWARSTLSRATHWLRSPQAPEEQNLPTRSVEKDWAMSGPLPAPIAWRVLSSSWPSVTFTCTFGYLAVKSATIDAIASDSRSVNWCQNSTVRAGAGAVAATSGAPEPGVQAAARTTVATATPARMPARVIFIIALL